jgi:hypothetical protein
MNKRRHEDIEVSEPSDFRRRKLAVILWIMGGGMLLALAWQSFQRFILGNGYPYNTFLFLPNIRFGDFSDTLFTARLPNPYFVPEMIEAPETGPD